MTQEIFVGTRSFNIEVKEMNGDIVVVIDFYATGNPDDPNAKRTGRVLLPYRVFEALGDKIVEARQEMKNLRPDKSTSK